MDWSVFWTAVGSVVAVVAFVYAILRNFKADIFKEFKEIREEIKEIREEIREIRKDISALTSRIDRLEVRVEERTFRVLYLQDDRKDAQ